MKTFWVVPTQNSNSVVELVNVIRFFSRERAEEYVELTKKWVEDGGLDCAFKIEEREEEDLFRFHDIVVPTKVKINYLNGLSTEAEVNSKNMSIGNYLAAFLLSCDMNAFDTYNELMTFKGETKHVVHDICLVSFDEIRDGVWRARYSLVGGVSNKREARGCMFYWEKEDKHTPFLDTIGDYFEQLGNLSIYW